MHRLVMGNPLGLFVDHRDRNQTLNNQKSNLRCANRCENGANRKAARAGRKGVYQDRGYWRAAITSGNTKHYLGYFPDETSAAIAYDAAAVRLHDEFALLNFPSLRA